MGGGGRGAPIAALVVILIAVSPASADERDLARVEIEIPSLVLERSGESEQDVGDVGIDETLLVRSSAKRLETVLETASIVTVLSADDLRARGYRSLADVLEEVPGFESQRYVVAGRRVPMARGAARTVLVLWNGVAINNPDSNLNNMWYDLPLDAVDRVEVVSGPGGVLWGANAYLGIVNVVTLRGDSGGPAAEARVTAGDGVGNRRAVAATATVSESLLDDRLSLFGHLSVWSSRDAAHTPPYDMYFAPFPGSPDGAITLNDSSGPLTTDRDICVPLVFNADYQLAASTVAFDLLGAFHCKQREEIDPRGIRVDQFADPETGMLFEGTASQRRYESTVAQLRWTKPFGGTGRLDARAYYAGFHKTFETEQFAPPGQFGPEAVSAEADFKGSRKLLNDGAYRIGANVDTSFDLGRQSVIAGVEGMYEAGRPWVISRAGTDIVTLIEEGELRSGSERTVVAGFANDKVRLPGRLAVEAGLRVQAGFGDADVSYDPLLLPGAALVWNPAGQTYLKLNVATGFRPPSFLGGGNASGGGFGATFVGVAGEVVPEKSRAVEAEVSTIVLENTRTLRRVHLRLGYQLSQLTDLILGRAADTRNAGTRIIHTVETRADVAFTRGHRLLLAGHFFHGTDSELGPIRHVANYKLHLGSDVALTEAVRGMLAVTVLGPREDLNRLPLVTDVANVGYIMPVGSVVLDRAQPVALVRAGLRVIELWDGRFDVAAFVENAFDAQAALPDPDYEKREAPYPLKMPGRSMFVTVTGRL